MSERLTAAQKDFTELAARGPDAEAWLARELELAIARRLRSAPEVARDQSTFMRTAVELLVGVTEKVARDIQFEPEYKAARAEDKESDAYHRAALEAAKEIWRKG